MTSTESIALKVRSRTVTKLLHSAKAIGILCALIEFSPFMRAIIMQEYIEFFKAHSMLSLAWVGLFVVLVASIIKSSMSKIKSISHQECCCNVQIVRDRSRGIPSKAVVVLCYIPVPLAVNYPLS